MDLLVNLYTGLFAALLFFGMGFWIGAKCGSKYTMEKMVEVARRAGADPVKFEKAFDELFP